MKTKINRLLLCIMLVCAASGALWSQEAVAKAADLINKNLILGEYGKAFSYAVFIIKYYGSEEMPVAEFELVSKTVASQARNLEKQERWQELREMRETLAIAPREIQQQAASSIKKADEYFAQKEAEKKKQAEEEERLLAEIKKAEAEKAQKEAFKAEKEEESRRIVSLFEETRRHDLEKERLRENERAAAEERERELELKRQEAEAQYRSELTGMIEVISKTNNEAISNVSQNNKSIMWGFGALILLVVGAVVAVVIVFVKQQKLQHEQFKSTLQTMQAMRTAPPAFEALPLSLQAAGLPSGTELPGRSPLMLEDSGMNESISGAVSGTNPDKLAMYNLIKSCKQYGTEIDKATGRKNVSGRVADLVYKISVQMGHTEHDAILFFAASLVYDIGFLSIDTSILRSECLTKQQFEVLQTHTTAGLNMVFFVNDEYRALFKDAVSKHHENLDGSGYPHGLKDADIPYIARVLRVVESYVALISSRNYREIRDRNAAVAELKDMPGHYDQTIVDALDSIV